MTELAPEFDFRAADDRAHLELFGSGQATFVDPNTGAVVANPEHPYLGVIDQARLQTEDEAQLGAALQSNLVAHDDRLAARRARRRLNMRIAEAREYVDEVLSVQAAKDLPLSQAKLFTDIRRSQEDRTTDCEPLDIIRQFGVTTLAEYHQTLNHLSSEQAQTSSFDGLAADIPRAAAGAREHSIPLAKHRLEGEAQSPKAHAPEVAQEVPEVGVTEPEPPEDVELYQQPIHLEYPQYYDTARNIGFIANIRDWYAQQDTFDKVIGWTLGTAVALTWAAAVDLHFHPVGSEDTERVTPPVALTAHPGDHPQDSMARYVHRHSHLPMAAARAYADDEVSTAMALLSTNKAGTKSLVLNSSGEFKSSGEFYAPTYMLTPSKSWIRDHKALNLLSQTNK